MYVEALIFIIIFISILAIIYLYTYLVPQISQKCVAKNKPITVNSNVVTMDVSLLLCSSGTYVCIYIACMCIITYVHIYKLQVSVCNYTILTYLRSYITYSSQNIRSYYISRLAFTFQLHVILLFIVIMQLCNLLLKYV